ncbi:flagellar basal body rod protein FlgB [Oryzibacter oryziterrae]|uniref:flagellar basal body rod protein FlgB n=1 Tax=Oryzibacter oryziterrae TaxID=2766474 RepID=UPI001F40EC5D|nr:flagellar basal body rod protein FlgB [Oryzibacter oryziterrae]
MSMTDIPMLQAIKAKLKYHELRQKVLAENVANAETPGYQGKDIKPQDFFRVAVEDSDRSGVMPITTSPLHMPGQMITNTGPNKEQTVDGYEVTPDGNSVSLEDQMMKVTDNQMDYQVATNLYQRSLNLLKTAVGKR